jgi:preprotein translocase subunit Sss1
MSTQEKDKGVLKELQEFFKSSKNFITNCEKPDAKGNLT